MFENDDVIINLLAINGVESSVFELFNKHDMIEA